MSGQLTMGGLLRRETTRRPWGFVLSALAAAVAVGVLADGLVALRGFDRETEAALARKAAELDSRVAALNDDMRKATLKLSFNLLILPAGQELRDLYAEDYAAKTMPEEYAARLAQSGLATIQHLMPCLQRKVRWPERDRTIILVGTRGEIPKVNEAALKPLAQPVPRGTVVLGYELHRTMGLTTGRTVRLMGRDFRVGRCYDERGSKDDITAWVHLADAQDVLGLPGRINVILALECLCVDADLLGTIRRDVARVLPDTQVVELGGKALARAEARQNVAEQGRRLIDQERASRDAVRADRERMYGRLAASLMMGAAVWIGLLAYANVRSRRMEIGMLRAMGVRRRAVLWFFACKALLAGVAGGLIGATAGVAIGLAGSGSLAEGLRATGAVWTAAVAAVAVTCSAVLAAVAGWVPAVLAAQQDPADLLARGE